jgi:excisionase family DNA binding protein
MEERITVQQAAQVRQCSDRHILRLIKRGELEAKREGHRWLILKSSLGDGADLSPPESDLISVLKAQLQEKDDQIRQLQERLSEKDKQIAEKDNQMERLHQLLAIEKTQTQQLLERQLLPFWKRWRRKQLPGPTDTAE